MIDHEDFRAALGAVCTPVAVVTSALDGRPHGATVSAFCSLSLDPPLVLVSLDRRSALLEMVEEAGAFGLNVLEHDQQELALGFARKGDDKFIDVDWSLDAGLPRLHGVGLWLACSVYRLVGGGDHIIVVGRIESAVHDARRPLLYQQRAFGTLAELAA